MHAAQQFKLVRTREEELQGQLWNLNILCMLYNIIGHGMPLMITTITARAVFFFKRVIVLKGGEKTAVWFHFIAHTHKFFSCLQLLSLSRKAQQVVFYAGTDAREFVWEL